MISCEKVNDETLNFYNTEDRIGRWISPDNRDTLEFIDNSNLIRKGSYYVHEEYLYRIDGKTLFIRLPGSTDETQHQILTVEENIVVLGNMYITIGFGDNPGTFIKQN